jgi:hypothetical protein
MVDYGEACPISEYTAEVCHPFHLKPATGLFDKGSE